MSSVHNQWIIHESQAHEKRYRAGEQRDFFYENVCANFNLLSSEAYGAAVSLNIKQYQHHDVILCGRNLCWCPAVCRSEGSSKLRTFRNCESESSVGQGPVW